MNISDHVTALFVGGLYYLFIGDEETADMCWHTAVQIVSMNVKHSKAGKA
jgi:hypothetical protein